MSTTQPTAEHLFCKNGLPAITHDGVAITADGEYWLIPDLQPGDFEGISTGIPDKATKISGEELLESGGDPTDYTSTREKANVAAVEFYVQWVQRRIESARQDMLLFERYYEKAYNRLSAHHVENNG